MSDVITGPGFYKQRDGQKAEIAGRLLGGLWCGHDEDRDPADWNSAGVFRPHLGEESNPHDIVSRWIEPKPFRISDHGSGVYLTRDGREATVTEHGRFDYKQEWKGTLGTATPTWFDDGRWSPFRYDQRDDIVRYLRPLPQPEPTFKVGDRVRSTRSQRLGRVEHIDPCGNAYVRDSSGYGFWINFSSLEHSEPEPEWTPTDHYQQTTIVGGCEWTSRWHGKPPSSARIEQKWTRGTEEEWRPVVTDGV